MDIAAELKKLELGNTGRSETSRLRDVEGNIERALAAGVSRRVIYEILQHVMGLTMTFDSFKIALHRLRKRRKKIGGNTNLRQIKSIDVNSDKTATETKRIPRITNPKELYESQQELRIEIDNYAQDHQYEE